MHNGYSTPTPQAPYIGVAPLNPSAPAGSVSLWAETFGGDDYRACDGSLPAQGSYGLNPPGYPGWDLPPGIAMFDVPLSSLYGQDDVTLPPIPVSGSFTFGPVFGAEQYQGNAEWSGTITISTKGCDSTAANCRVLAQHLLFSSYELGPADVVRDRLAQDGADQTINDINGGCGDRGAHWVACTTPDSPDKVWPYTTTQGGLLDLAEQRIRGAVNDRIGIEP